MLLQRPPLVFDLWLTSSIYPTTQPRESKIDLDIYIYMYKKAFIM